MAKSAGERAILKEEKREEREKKRRIEQANKMLIPVSKKTNLSLGIISFDPEGTFRLTDKRWMKVFEADGDVSNLMANMKNLSGRIRITLHLGADSGRDTMDLVPGDLVYYGGDSNGRYMGIYHVAIYVGNGKAVEALNTEYGVVYQTLRTKNAIMVCRPNK